MKRTVRPGELAPASGIYREYGPRGGNTNNEISLIKGTVVPPTSQKGGYYKLIRATTR
ncbi:MAG: hypothetical protein KatS3mg005_3983 [Bryobacteraceae bacterium]|nr:MAG: hypothetical protein KatS3mg005_3983 [Bryobacteraceae bacterium]